MISAPSGFKLLDRGFKETIVLIPGWATDHRIFDTLDLNYNYLLPVKYNPDSFNEELLKSLEENSLDKFSLFGWSLGGFLAAEFASGRPERVDKLILISVRTRFDRKKLEEIKGLLTNDKRAYLYKFYLECFSDNDKEELAWFKKNLLKDYIHEMETADLICGLDYLSRASINPVSLAPVKKIRIFHGTEDTIAPLKEAEEIKLRLPQAGFIRISGAGHSPFLNRDFRKRFHDE